MWFALGIQNGLIGFPLFLMGNTIQLTKISTYESHLGMDYLRISSTHCILVRGVDIKIEAIVSDNVLTSTGVVLGVDVIWSVMVTDENVV